VQGICLNQQALEIQLAPQFFEQSALMVFTRGIAGLANRHTEL